MLRKRFLWGRRWIVFCAIFGLLGAVTRGGAEPHRWAPLTVVLANADDPASLRLAEAYANGRGLPERNLIALSMPKGDQITRQEFVETIWNPLRATLLERGFLVGEATEETDLIGRRNLSLTAAQIRYLVTIRGVPYRIRELADLDDTELFLPGGEAGASIDGNVSGEGAPQAFTPDRFPPQLRKNQASVDSELSLLFFERPPLTGFVPNPLFGKIEPNDGPAQVVRVGRLDGPSEHAVRRMMESAWRAEAVGLRGRAYFDLAQRTGNYAVGERWIQRAADLAEAVHFDTTVDKAKGVFPLTARFDAPAIYFGWYTGNYAGVFRLPEFEFPVGAVAAHLHSSSASNLRNATRGWSGPLIQAGVAATVGNVYEPYLEQTHHFDKLLEALLAGANFGDAAYAAVPSLSWQTVALGDPLYEPFKVTLAEQVAMIGDLANAASDPYVVLREVNRLEAEDDARAARIAAVRAFYQTPGPALALRLARMDAAREDPEAARRRLEFAAQVRHFSPQEWSVFAEIAEQLVEWEQHGLAADIYRNLIENAPLPESYRFGILERASRAAREGGQSQLSAGWLREWNEIKVRREAAKES